MVATATYGATRARVEDYFDRTATRAWARLTSDARVSGIRQTVREGRDRMRATMLARLPGDLAGLRVLDAGCGTGQMTAELAARGARVVAVDLSPALVGIARKRLPEAARDRVTFRTGDMLSADLGSFDHVVAMDSLIYYEAGDLGRALAGLSPRVRRSVLFTVAPKTALLMALWRVGRLFPRADRAPAMIPHDPADLAGKAALHGAPGRVRAVGRVRRGFYVSTCLEYAGCAR